jgi:aminobenzoyl-glutamate transport protein
MKQEKSDKKNRSTILVRALDSIESAGNKLPNPAILFLYLTIITMVISAICAAFGVSVTFWAVDMQAGGTIERNVSAVSLLSAAGFRHLVTTVISSFVNFFPLGTVFTIILGVGVANGSGFLTALLRNLAVSTPKRFVTATVVFLGIFSSIASSTGYVVLVPLGALLFIAFGRHPIAGLAAAFAGVSGGWGANILISSADPMFAGISTQAAQIIDPNYVVQPIANWYFMIVSTVMLTIIGTIVTEKIVEPRLAPYTSNEEHDKVELISSAQKRGMRFAGIAALAYIALMLFLTLPAGALLRHPQTGALLVSPFMSSIIFFMMLLFLIPGIFFGIGAGTIKSSKDVIMMMNKSIADLSSFLVLIFFAAQFTNAFNHSNLGMIISIAGGNFLQDIGFLGLPLIIAFIVATYIINIFIAIDSAKWAIMAPIFVPMFMNLGLSPELTQAAYRIGDSASNIITPIMPFFVLTVAFFQKYDKKAGIGSVVSTMLPYSIAFLLSWIVLVAAWYLLGLPLGPGAGLVYP